jgi:cephalosporin hydroxylase
MIVISEEQNFVEVQTPSGKQRFSLASPEAFAAVSRAWLRCGWDSKHVYTFTWLGRPIIQLPEDLIRLQEVIYLVKPDVIIETGVAHGGGLIFYATLCKAMNKGRVIGVDIEIRPHNRAAIEAHELSPLITLVEGSSTAPEIVARVKSLIPPGAKVFVLLDSNHTKDHVLGELNAYCDLVSSGSYIVATDGIMKDLVGAPRSNIDWAENNPFMAVQAFLPSHPEFQQEQPRWLFNESNGLHQNTTYWPGAYLKRI